ncbi:MAG: Na+/H+ antiporter NhaC family protein [Clostridia bacterium]|nr:Na+/H+ antiporter NhaC family protein [Clostridia bacterium]
MSKKKIITTVIAAAVLLGLLIWALVQVLSGASLVGTAWSLFPPLVAIILALITKEAYSSLFIGILVGGFMACDFKPIQSMDSVISDGLIEAVSGTAGIFVFLVLLGAVVALLNKAGVSRAFGDWASKHVKSKVGASLATFFFGVLIFIDDYFNCLTVGAVMKPVTDKAGISRAKLAYLIDATAAPVCMIAPISSWAAAVSEYAPEGESGLAMFIRAIPYNFYSLLTFVFIFAIVLMKFDFGPMRQHELNAAKGDLFTVARAEGEAEEVEIASNSRAKLVDLILPIVVLIGICVYALVHVGGGFEVGFITAFGDTDATVGLPWGALIALIVTIFYFALRKLVSLKDAMACIGKGFIAMVPAILILTLATSLKNMTGLLESDAFVESALANAGALHGFLPAIVFLVACFIAFATGTSWGTFGILIPIVLAIFPAGSTLGVIGMSACLAGAVCGDHCSPISDTTIMSSAGAECNHIAHVSTQLPYAITVAVISFVCFLIAGFVQNVYLCLGVGAVLVIGTLFVAKKLSSRKA